MAQTGQHAAFNVENKVVARLIR